MTDGLDAGHVLSLQVGSVEGNSAMSTSQAFTRILRVRSDAEEDAAVRACAEELHEPVRWPSLREIELAYGCVDWFLYPQEGPEAVS
jgi:hypothetical protein